jgi:hypothetical protein
MKPLSEMPLAVLRGIRFVFFDIDDTLTTHGRLTAAAYSVLESLHAAGLVTVPITGRPAGWCDHIARMWPVDGVVGENGAFYFCFDRAAGKMRQRFVKDDATRAQDRARLDELARNILREVPGCAMASDQAFRQADIAIDFCEDVPALPEQQVRRIRDLMERAGLTAKISSIHVNGWIGNYDKLSTARLFMAERHHLELDAVRSECIFVGDSPNDAPMFAFFPHAVGVANVGRFVPQLKALPAFVTGQECGAGFVELAELLLSTRRG